MKIKYTVGVDRVQKIKGKKQQILSTAVLLPFEMRCSAGLPQTQKEGRHLGLGGHLEFFLLCVLTTNTVKSVFYLL